MSEIEDIEREMPVVAAEYALGLLEGDERETAEDRYDRDEAFAWRKKWWDNWFAPWTDEMPAAAPDPGVWDRIVQDIRTTSNES